MKKIAIASIMTLSLIYSVADTTISSAAVEYEHDLKSAHSVEETAEDMSKMKAMGKCGADQKAAKSTPAKKPTKAELEYEHDLKSAHSEEETAEDMGDMKAQGKCGTAK